MVPPFDALAIRPTEHEDAADTCHESRDVRHERNATCRLAGRCCGDGSDAAQKLHDEPYAEEKDRRHLDDLKEDENGSRVTIRERG